MPDVRIVWSGDGLRELFAGPESPVAKDLARRAEAVRGEAVRRCPVNTGRLRSSIRWSLVTDEAGLVALVGSDVEYALWVHEGARGRQGVPFLVDALQVVVN
jgi:hypothetical protein